MFFLKQKKINFIWIFFYLFIFCLLLQNSFSYLDPDFGWHLQVGKEIIQNKSVPQTEHFIYPLAGQNWVDHEWLINIITFLIYHNLGYIALNIFFAFLVLLTLIILHNNIKKKHPFKNIDLALMFFSTLGIYASFPHLGIRMQEIALLNLLFLYLIFDKYSQKQNHKTLFLLIFLFYFWSSLHGSFLIAIVLSFAFLFFKIIEKYLSKFSNKLYFIDFKQVISYKKSLLFALFLFLSIISTFFTPYGLELYSFLSTYRDKYYLSNILEWLPFYYYPIMYWQLFFIAIIIAIITILFYSALKKIKNFDNQPYKIKLWQFLLSLLFVFLALKSRRHFPLLFISAYPILIDFVSFHLKKNSSNFIYFFSEFKKNKLITIYIYTTFIVVSSLILLKTNFTQKPFQNFSTDYPQEAISFLKENPKYNDYKLFNTYSWGGYLIWEYPEKKIFIDGRLPQYNFGKHTMLAEYSDFFEKEKTSQKLSEHNIDLILIQKPKKFEYNFLDKFIFNLQDNQKKISKKEIFINYLKKSTAWEVIYEDNISYLFINIHKNGL